MCVYVFVCIFFSFSFFFFSFFFFFFLIDRARDVSSALFSFKSLVIGACVSVIPVRFVLFMPLTSCPKLRSRLWQSRAVKDWGRSSRVKHYMLLLLLGIMFWLFLRFQFIQLIYVKAS